MSKKENAGVFQLENGNWGYRFIIKLDGKRKAQKRVRDELGNPFKTEKQAIKAREKAIYMEKFRLHQPQEKKMERKTIEAVYKEYCEYGRKGRAWSTIKRQDGLWKNYIMSAFGKRYLDNISVAEINDYLCSLYYVKQLSYGYVESILKQFYLIFGQAYSRNYINVNDYNKLCVNKNGRIKMPNKKSTDVKEIVAYNREELTKLDRFFKGKTVETAYVIGRYSGLRCAECYGLTWDCIDFDKGLIRVEKQMQTQEGIYKLIPLKTQHAKRKVYMHKELKQYLLELKEKIAQYEVDYAEHRQQNEIFITDLDGSKISSLTLVNTLPNGKIQTEHAIRHYAKYVKKECNIEFRFHYLRRTYGTYLALLNTPEHILSNQMGHSRSATTHKYYLAVTEDGIAELKNNLDKI